MLGIFAEPMIEILWTQGFLAVKSAPAIIYLIVTITLGTSIIIWEDMRQNISLIASNTGRISTSVGHKLQIIPYRKGYQELQERIENARNEIRVLSNYVFDWENGKPIYDEERLLSPERRASYSVTNAKIEREAKRGQFKFVKIIQIPSGHNLEEILSYDSVYKEQCELLACIGRITPELACLRKSEVIFRNSFVLIDRSFLYMEIEINDPYEEQVQAPFVLILEDPDSIALDELLRLHQRIEANSELVTNIE
jgi:hypothetical protein